MNARHFAALLPLLITAAAQAEDTAPIDPRIRDLDYHAGLVYPLTARVGYQIDLQFEPGERFVGLAAGDVEAVGFEAQDNHVFLKPKATSISTNLTILTDRRPYYFEYQLERLPKGTLPRETLFAVRFHYAPPPVQVVPRTEPIAPALDAPVPAVNTRYSFCGSRALKPSGAWDDGVRTHLTFPAQAELPALFVLNEDGSESLVNFTVTPEGLTLHRIARRFVLRRGTQSGCILNEGFEGSGHRLATGTVSESVQRESTAP